MSDPQDNDPQDNDLTWGEFTIAVIVALVFCLVMFRIANPHWMS